MLAKWFIWLAGASLVAAIAVRQEVVGAQTPAGAAASPEYFEANVRPILAANCYDCHADKQSGGLRVDSRQGLLTGGDSGPVIVPGDPDKSLLIQAVKRLPDAPQMPAKRPKLSDKDIAVLVDWVKAGAPWPASDAKAPAPVTPPTTKPFTPEQRAYWAFQPLASPAIPAVRNIKWAKTNIDRFVLARLEKDGLAPAAPADKLTLIRRATMDLTGLPPTPDEVTAFLRDSSPTALAKVVDRLLASPRYGETWGRMWLDVARYGEDDYRSLDPKGRGLAPYENAYLYRDWVIKAFNDDLPYDQFVRAQLAADLTDNHQRIRNLPALGFLGLGPWYYDNGAVEITRADERHDKVDAVSRGLLGITVGCARCHDHKYDPIPTRDYYALAGVFLNTQYTEYPLAPKSVVDEYQAAEKKIEKKEDLLGEFLGRESQQLAGTLVFQASKYMQAAWKVSGEPKKPKHSIVESDKLDYELFDRWLRFLAKPPKFYSNLIAWQDMVKAGGTAAQAKKLGDQFQDELVDVLLAKKAVDEENEIIRAKALPTTKKKERANLPNEFITNDDFCPGCGLELKSMPVEKTKLYADVFSRDLEAETVAGQDPALSMPGLLSFSGWGLKRQLGPDRRDMIAALEADIEAMTKALPPKFPYVHGVKDVATPTNLKVSLRGSAYRLGDEAPRGFPTILTPAPLRFTKGSGRAELADAIVANPLAIRVIVNRVWKGHLGTGIVDTPSNFGRNGDRPSHPELLDYLAHYFLDHKMSIKALTREIMLSQMYQLSVTESAANADKDGGNRLYWRANTHRLTAEQIRDSVLFVSGALDTKMGGPSIPLTPLATRRTVYGKVSRYKLDEFLQLFDFPSPSQSAEKRFSTNVPLQRLFFMNSDFMQQHAERLAARVVGEADDTARVEKAYRLIFGRVPTPAEVQAAKDFLAAEPMKQYEEKKAAAAKKDADAKTKPAAPSAPSTPTAEPPMVGMMSGVVPGKPGDQDEGEMLPVTVFGRYVKALLSSNEFLFIR